MTQPERIITKRVDMVDELACVRGEMSEAYTGLLRALIVAARTIARVDELIIAVAPRHEDPAPAPKSAERPAPAPQAATPARVSPVAQDEGRTVQGRRAPDEVPGRGAGIGLSPGQSGECRHAAGAGGASAASADTAPAADEKKRINEVQAAALENALGQEPCVPRRPAQVAPGYEQVQDGGPLPVSRADQVLDLWATTLLSYDEIAAKLKINPNSPSAYLSTARGKNDPRAKQGDEPREKIRYDKAMDAYVSTNDTPSQIDRKLSLPAGLTQRFITKAWGNGDQRVKDGDTRRRPAAPKAASSRPQQIKAEEIARDPMAIPEGFVIAVDRKHGEIVGPAGSWACAPLVGKALAAIADGHLRGIDRMADSAGCSDKVITASLHLWQSSLRKIGVDLVHTPHIGCKLNRIAA